MRASVTCMDLLAVVLSTFTNYFVFRNCEEVANCESWILFSLSLDFWWTIVKVKLTSITEGNRLCKS